MSQGAPNPVEKPVTIRRLKPREIKFVVEYLKADGKNAAACAVRAGYPPGKGATATASLLLTRNNIQAAIKEQLDAQQTRTLITADRILTELYRVAVCDVGLAVDDDQCVLPLKQIPEDVRRAISSFEIEELFEKDARGRKIKVGVVKKIKFWNKNEAVITLAKHLKLIVERIDHTSDGKTVRFTMGSVT